MAPSNEELVIRQKLKELAALVELREQTQDRITKTEAAISAFIELLEDETDQVVYKLQLKAAAKPYGLTESIKRILRDAKKPLTPTDVKDRLAQNGFPLSGYSNPGAVIYTTLMRLRDQGLAKETDEKENGIFLWVATDKLTNPSDAALISQRTRPISQTVSVVSSRRTRPRKWMSLADQKKEMEKS